MPHRVAAKATYFRCCVTFAPKTTSARTSRCFFIENPIETGQIWANHRDHDIKTCPRHDTIDRSGKDAAHLKKMAAAGLDIGVLLQTAGCIAVVSLIGYLSRRRINWNAEVKAEIAAVTKNGNCNKRRRRCRETRQT